MLPVILRDMQIGRGRCSFPAVSAKKMIDEQRIRGVSSCPSYNFEVIDSLSDQFSGCQFLDVKEEGKALIGCWGVSSNGADYPSCSQVISYKVSVDHAKAERESRLRDTGKSLLDTNGRFSSNTYGLRFETVDNCINVDSTLVDMTIAPADSDVTVMIYATANSYVSNSYNSYKIITRCKVFLKAVDQLTKEEGKDSMSSPIYNAEWMTNEHIWSCAFDSNHMRVGVGMENCAAVFDVLNESKFKVSSGGKNVIAQQYSKEGDILYLGRRNANISSLICECLIIILMENRPNHILTDNFNGKLKLWDNRTRSCVLELDGHRNSSHKVPCFVDASERFVFAVGEDAIARGWSLGSGELLCSIDCPRNRWGGLNGNAAIILAGLKGDLSVHELPMI
uniref:Uncharacterized protein n=1 Tax=Ditylenchus dipsaci TaxID=166011 RepID=A0A915CYT9_9BILA